MFVQDKIADMLTRIRNANQMRYTEVEVEGTKMTKGIAEILKNEGYIADYKYTKNSQNMITCRIPHICGQRKII